LRPYVPVRTKRTSSSSSSSTNSFIVTKVGMNV